MDKSIARGILRDIVHHIKSQPVLEEVKVDEPEVEEPEEEVEEEEDEEEEEQKPKRKPLYFGEVQETLPTRRSKIGKHR